MSDNFVHDLSSDWMQDWTEKHPMSTQLNVIATIVAKPGSADEVRSLLLPAVAAFRAEPGCQSYVLLEDRKQEGRFVTFEAWTNEEALSKHMNSPAMSALSPKLKTLLNGEIRQELLTSIASL